MLMAAFGSYLVLSMIKYNSVFSVCFPIFWKKNLQACHFHLCVKVKNYFKLEPAVFYKSSYKNIYKLWVLAKEKKSHLYL